MNLEITSVSFRCKANTSICTSSLPKENIMAQNQNGYEGIKFLAQRQSFTRTSSTDQTPPVLIFSHNFYLKLDFKLDGVFQSIEQEVQIVTK